MGVLLAGIQLIGGPLAPVVATVAATAVLLVVVAASTRRPRWRWLLASLAAAGIGAGLGVALCWLLGDVVNLFGVYLTWTSRGWVAASCAALGVIVMACIRPRTPRRGLRIGLGITAALAAIATGALGINADFGQYTTLAGALGLSSIPRVPDSVLATQLAAVGAAAAPPSGSNPMPSHGLVGSVTIPGQSSGFPARSAVIYLPPAALVDHPAPLPVLVMLSGQPGSPENVMLAGHVNDIFDRIAAANGGAAPIVVVPDQLGNPFNNPMCVDSALGNVQTYLTVDVPNWIRTHFAVRSGAQDWAIGGWSEGGTCAIQLGAAHPTLFGSIVDVSGELEPRNGSLAETIARGFGGSAARYAQALPETLLAARAPYTDTVAVFAVGERDEAFGPAATALHAAASAAGIRSTLVVSPGTAHDWATVDYALSSGLGPVLAQMSLREAR